MKKYYKDYKLVSKFRQNGKVTQAVEYSGSYYVSRLSKTELIKKKLYCLTLALCSDIVLICAGLFNTSGSRVFYVALPYVSLFLPAVFCLMGSVSFALAGSKLEYAAYDKSISRIRRSAAAQMVIGVIAAAGDIIYLIHGKNVEKLSGEYVFTVCMLIMILSVIVIIRVLKTAAYSAEEKDDTVDIK